MKTQHNDAAWRHPLQNQMDAAQILRLMHHVR